MCILDGIKRIRATKTATATYLAMFFHIFTFVDLSVARTPASSVLSVAVSESSDVSALARVRVVFLNFPQSAALTLPASFSLSLSCAFQPI